MSAPTQQCTEAQPYTEITSAEQLTELIGSPLPATVNKERDRLDDLDVQWLKVSPFCVVATSDADGNVDASPKGDPAGRLAYVIDDRTIAIAERPGNKRADGYHNILSNPHVGLLFLIPGRGDTLRINGRARLVSDAPFFDQLIVKGHRPLLALVVEIDTIFHHCAKAFLRSQLWKPETWQPDAMPSRAEIAKRLDKKDEDFETLKSYYDEDNYSQKLYRG
ncbi:pyridoxamine 5'-phosphate oxidase family protein [Microlunatus elymi]|uniref:Pyridoxamine 5'-phosphate oxidase family protein n=1 Tax=Microlunatus elymi TaxID=2596828 RepID=A0A516PXM6_9ACTN|nr:pyridoxamine 5'-phosphate oxidase family protein [Microlunatus elymi]QDP95939.1 pyridoxamine 5'-phosphate oxidase family protein [Microlunatus elymi]